MLEELRDIDGEGLRTNHEHERWVSSSYLSNFLKLRNLVVQQSQENTKYDIEQRRQAAINCRLNKTVHKQSEQIQKILEENRTQTEQSKKVAELNRSQS